MLFVYWATKVAYFFSYKAQFQHDFFKFANWKLSQSTRLWGTAGIFDNVHLNYNNMLSNNAD